MQLLHELLLLLQQLLPLLVAVWVDSLAVALCQRVGGSWLLAAPSRKACGWRRQQWGQHPVAPTSSCLLVPLQQAAPFSSSSSSRRLTVSCWVVSKAQSQCHLGRLQPQLGCLCGEAQAARREQQALGLTQPH